MRSKVIGVIPARWGSTRLPGKMLADIAGKPLILHTLLNAEHARTLDKLMIATDDERIAEVVSHSGHEVVMTDPELPSGSDRIWAAVQDRSEYDLIVNIQEMSRCFPCR